MVDIWIVDGRMMIIIGDYIKQQQFIFSVNHALLTFHKLTKLSLSFHSIFIFNVLR